MRTFCARTDPRLVSIKRTICMGLVERQADIVSDVVFDPHWYMLLVWHQDVLRRVGRGMGTQVLDFYNVISHIPGLNVVFFEREHVHRQDLIVYSSFIYDCWRSVVLEITHV